MNFLDLKYLINGTKTQKHVYKLLFEAQIFEILAGYTPVLTGTIPLGIDIQGSDLDIICTFNNIDKFYSLLKNNFTHYKNFKIRKDIFQNKPTVISTFVFNNYLFEIFAQQVPVTDQYAYRHMVTEYRLLKIGGKKAFNTIKKLKIDGYKTEPAFAKYFSFKGDPYTTLFNFYNMTDEEMKRMIK